jgi:hypothetical protein
MHPKYSVTCLFLVIACNNSTQKTTEAKPLPISTRTAVSDARGVADFGRAWAEIASITDELQRRTRAHSLINEWEGRQYEWDGFMMFSLCDEQRRRCSANVVERKQVPSPDLLGGFFPSLFFTEDGFAQLRQHCKGKTSCVVRFRGVLSSLRADPDMPLGMDFKEVTTLRGRDTLPSEVWWKEGPSFEIPKDFQPDPAPLASANEPPLPPLKVKIVEKVF